MHILLCVVVCLVGLVVYALSGNIKIAELGRLSFFAGLLASLVVFSGAALHLS